MTTKELSAALVDAINSSTRPPALWPIARVKYPGRECQVKQLSGNCFTVSLARWGYEYKHRGPRPKIVPPLNLSAIQAEITAALPDGYAVAAVQDCKTHIVLTIGGVML
jgi:hypothetical protein